jgi:hypothetical protein
VVVAVLPPTRIATVLPCDGGQVKVFNAAAVCTFGAQGFTTVVGAETVTVADALLAAFATEVAVTMHGPAVAGEV